MHIRALMTLEGMSLKLITVVPSSASLTFQNLHDAMYRTFKKIFSVMNLFMILDVHVMFRGMQNF